MDIDVEPQGDRTEYSGSQAQASLTPVPILWQDEAGWLSQIRQLRSTDIIILLTPIVVPHNVTDVSDTFEPLGRALSMRHSKIRHVPYTRNGITSTHLGFIKRGHAIILCLAEQPLRLGLAEVTLAIRDNKPVVVILCSSDTQGALPFPTIIQVANYTQPALEATAALIFAGHTQTSIGSLPADSKGSSTQAKVWQVEEFEEQKDMSSISILWLEYCTARFHVDQQTLGRLLRKPGYAKHYVVRDPASKETLGFCATYLSYVDREGVKLVASLAILIVTPKRRLQGIGLSLHSHAMSQLKRTRGIIRLQLGSMFPRIPVMRTNDGWLHRRGWLLDKGQPGQGQAIYDLLLDFRDWQRRSSQSQSEVTFRLCSLDDMSEVLALVEKVTIADASRLGWFDQYWGLINSPSVKDIVAATEGDTIVGAALTYRPDGSQISTDLPWSRQIGSDCGGVTCISISSQQKDRVFGGLINACVENLQKQGMTRLLLDGVTGDLSDLVDLGFREWASYRGVWKDI